MSLHTERRTLKRLYRKTGSILRLARLLSLSTATVRRRLSEHGIVVKSRGRPRKPLGAPLAPSA